MKMKENIKIVVAEDYKHTQELITTILERDGYLVVGKANDGLEAIELYQQHKPDILTVDIDMPYKNGLQVVREITSEYPDAKILMISGHANLKKQARMVGAAEFLAKPFSPTDLLKMVQLVLSSIKPKDKSLNKTSETRESNKVEEEKSKQLPIWEDWASTESDPIATEKQNSMKDSDEVQAFEQTDTWIDEEPALPIKDADQLEPIPFFTQPSPKEKAALDTDDASQVDNPWVAPAEPEEDAALNEESTEPDIWSALEVSEKPVGDEESDTYQEDTLVGEEALGEEDEGLWVFPEENSFEEQVCDSESTKQQDIEDVPIDFSTKDLDMFTTVAPEIRPPTIPTLIIKDDEEDDLLSGKALPVEINPALKDAEVGDDSTELPPDAGIPTLKSVDEALEEKDEGIGEEVFEIKPPLEEVDDTHSLESFVPDEEINTEESMEQSFSISPPMEAEIETKGFQEEERIEEGLEEIFITPPKNSDSSTLEVNMEESLGTKDTDVYSDVDMSMEWAKEKPSEGLSDEPALKEAEEESRDPIIPPPIYSIEDAIVEDSEDYFEIIPWEDAGKKRGFLRRLFSKKDKNDKKNKKNKKRKEDKYEK